MHHGQKQQRLGHVTDLRFPLTFGTWYQCWGIWLATHELVLEAKSRTSVASSSRKAWQLWHKMSVVLLYRQQHPTGP